MESNSLKSLRLKKKIQTQNIIIVALVIVIFVLVIVSSTAAWYITTKTDSADFILSNPVNIYITEFKPLKDAQGNNIYNENNEQLYQHTEVQNLTDTYKNIKIYPGDKIDMKLGVQIGNKVVESSPAYVRVKLIVTYENIYTGEVSQLKDFDDKLIDYKEGLVDKYWEPVDFNMYDLPGEDGEPVKSDVWFVLKETDNHGNQVARKAYNLDTFEFVDGYIKLDRLNVTNKHANCQMHVNYIVEAIQVKNIPDPLVERKGPWWDKEDIIYN